MRGQWSRYFWLPASNACVTAPPAPTFKKWPGDVLAGHTNLRQIAVTDAYGPMLLDRFHRFKEWEENLDPDERQRLADEATAAARDDSSPTADNVGRSCSRLRSAVQRPSDP
ncbi:hypothetical protein [Micromonospora chalcea]|uniref:hypothetical protein n=1 Tax=Micromonospora chalcea TaxID=1874 RepID=UPI00157BC919|nr:hypothetical protein [Micromonospora chalcea]